MRTIDDKDVFVQYPKTSKLLNKLSLATLSPAYARSILGKEYKISDDRVLELIRDNNVEAIKLYLPYIDSLSFSLSYDNSSNNSNCLTKALYISVVKGYIEMIELLLDEAPLSLTYASINIIKVAIKYRKLDIIKILVNDVVLAGCSAVSDIVLEPQILESRFYTIVFDEILAKGNGEMLAYLISVLLIHKKDDVIEYIAKRVPFGQGIHIREFNEIANVILDTEQLL